MTAYSLTWRLKVKDTFTIKNCTLRGCHHNQREVCRLEDLPIMNFADSMQFFRDSNTCQVRFQISMYKTEKLIGND